MTTLLRSQIITGCCDSVIASLHGHDCHRCPCGQTFIDGGRDYLRIGGHIHSYTPAHIEVEGDLTNEEARSVLSVYRAIYKAWEDSRNQRGVPLSAIGKYQWPDQKYGGSALRLSDCIKLLSAAEHIYLYDNAKGQLRIEPLTPYEVRA